MKKTAIDYLIEQMNMQGFFGVYCTEDKIDENRKLMTKIIEQAKAMHKEEIMDAFAVGCHVESTRLIGYHGMAEQYYNENYGGNK